MSITATLAKMKNYFETWHTKEYERLHIAYDDSSVQSLIEDIKSKLPKDQFGNITQVYSKADVDNLVGSISNQVTNIRNSIENYYNKTEIDSAIASINAKLDQKLNKDGSNGGWKSISSEAVNGGWTSSNITININEYMRMGHVNFAMPFDSATKGKFYEWNYMTLPPKYRPVGQAYGSCKIGPSNNAGGGNGGTGILRVSSTGKLGGVFDIGWSVGDARDVNGTVYWRY